MVRIAIRTIVIGCLASVLLLLTAIVIGKVRKTALLSFIAEIDDTVDIYLYDPSTSFLHNVTQTQYTEWSFGWSQQGDLLYTATVRLNQAADELFVMNRLGVPQLIETPDTLFSFGSVWSPDAKTLAYFSSHPTNYSDIFVVTFPDATVQNLTQTQGISETNPQWSPDGQQLLYLSQGNLHIVELDNGAINKIADLDAAIDNPIWSPNGERIAFTIQLQDKGRNVQQIYTIAADGTDLQPISLEHPPNTPVSWSPDSQQVALVANNSTTLVLYDLRDDSFVSYVGEHRRYAPAWSPDGHWLAFIENRQIHLLDILTGDIQALAIDGRITPVLLWQPQ